MNLYLQRCLELARKGGAAVEPNPRVGSVVVYNGKIIGEGWHQFFGGPHAEVNAIASVEQKELLPYSTIYVSLEPCNHHGKTPPCADLILEHRIPKVVIGSLDPNPKMAGRSVKMLREQGVSVEVAADQSPFQELNEHFWYNQKHHRPFITLKWAESQDGFIAGLDEDGRPVSTAISPSFVSRWVHALRHEHQAILVGKNTVLTDDPSLTTRKWPGDHPTRIFLDRKLEIPSSAKIYGPGKVIVINELKNQVEGDTTFFVPVEEEAFDDLGMLMTELYGRLRIGSILVEGGRSVLDQFIAQGIWNEAWKNIGSKRLGEGIQAPTLPNMEEVSNTLGVLWNKKNPALRFP